MTLRRYEEDRQFDLFVPYVSDFPLRDQRETMERPFFSISKKKRLKPIEYLSPDGSIWVRVNGMPQFGMATIWDADILIWAASLLMEMKERGVNDIPRTLHFQPCNLLRAIRRDDRGKMGGKRYELLRESLNRLKFTGISTNIRAEGKKRARAFGWLDEWTEEIDSHTGATKGMSLTLSDWMYEGIVMKGGVLSLHPDYFLLTGGMERCLYRIARKHAGKQDSGWTCTLKTLYEKTGSDSPLRKFKFNIERIVKSNALPEYHLEWKEDPKNSSLWFVHRSLVKERISDCG